MKRNIAMITGIAMRFLVFLVLGNFAGIGIDPEDYFGGNKSIV